MENNSTDNNMNNNYCTCIKNDISYYNTCTVQCIYISLYIMYNLDLDFCLCRQFNIQIGGLYACEMYNSMLL